MGIYCYQHPITKEIFEEIRMVKDRNKKFISIDGKKCKRILFPPTKRGTAIINKNAEVFEKDPEYVRKVKPKYVRYRDGHREKYNPTKHC